MPMQRKQMMITAAEPLGVREKYTILKFEVGNTCDEDNNIHLSLFFSFEQIQSNYNYHNHEYGIDTCSMV
jgi:hypothetical protein